MTKADDKREADEKSALSTVQTTVRAAVSWHLSGADWPTIAERFNFTSPQAARFAVEKFEGDMVSSTDIEAARAKALGRYESLLRGQWSDAINPFLFDEHGKPTKTRNAMHPQAFERARAILGDIARLGGLNAPAQIQFQTPGTEELLSVVHELRDRALGGTAREVDIFDAEFEDDDAAG